MQTCVGEAWTPARDGLDVVRRLRARVWELRGVCSRNVRNLNFQRFFSLELLIVFANDVSNIK